MLKIDGSLHSGSGTIVRQAVAYAALTGEAIHLTNARVRREKPGLRRQHVRVIEAISELVNGTAEGASEGSRELVFRPGKPGDCQMYHWDIGSAGSTTMLALAVLPVLAFRSVPVAVEIQGGLFQDFAPSYFHVKYVMLPLLNRMGLEAEIDMERPGYVPQGGGRVRLTVKPSEHALSRLILDECGPVERLWGIALSSHLAARKVSSRMAESAKNLFASGGYQAGIDLQEDATAAQPGAALAVFADCEGGARLGADQAGARGRPAEAIGRHVARELLCDLKTGATLDRFAADQIIPFAALAAGESRFAVPMITDHMDSSAWLANKFLGASVRMDGRLLSVIGRGLQPIREGIALRRV